jgi:hypothetical protein
MHWYLLLFFHLLIFNAVCKLIYHHHHHHHHYSSCLMLLLLVLLIADIIGLLNCTVLPIKVSLIHTTFSSMLALPDNASKDRF